VSNGTNNNLLITLGVVILAIVVIYIVIIRNSRNAPAVDLFATHTDGQNLVLDPLIIGVPTSMVIRVMMM
jgi:hypothetical protein